MSKWIEARELSIEWINDPSYWQWVKLPGSRSEVAKLLRVCWLDILAKIDVKDKKLDIKTGFGAYLVFKLEDASQLEKATASVRFVREIPDIAGAGMVGYTVFIDKEKKPGENGVFPQPREDGWMEIKLGQFFNNIGDDGEVQIRLFETSDEKWKRGLLVRGIDVRPN